MASYVILKSKNCDAALILALQYTDVWFTGHDYSWSASFDLFYLNRVFF